MRAKMPKYQKKEWVGLIVEACSVDNRNMPELNLPDGYRRRFTEDEAMRVLDGYLKLATFAPYAQMTLRRMVTEEQRNKETDDG